MLLSYVSCLESKGQLPIGGGLDFFKHAAWVGSRINGEYVTDDQGPAEPGRSMVRCATRYSQSCLSLEANEYGRSCWRCLPPRISPGSLLHRLHLEGLGIQSDPRIPRWAIITGSYIIASGVSRMADCRTGSGCSETQGAQLGHLVSIIRASRCICLLSNCLGNWLFCFQIYITTALRLNTQCRAIRARSRSPSCHLPWGDPAV